MTRPLDTSEEVRRMQVAAIRAMTPTRRVQMAIEMSELAMQISKAGTARREREAATE